jgi:GTP-binding protein Era
VLAINKIDLFDKRLLLPLIARLQELFGPLGVPGFECVPISALNIDGVTLLEDCILQGLPEGPPLFPEDAVTDQPDEFYAAEIIREKLIGRLGQELPYSLAVQIERWQEEDSLLRLNAVIFVERDSQKAIVIGKGGTMLKSVGTAARLELERFFGTKVYLELFVKVEKAWTSSERGLSKAGYRAGNSY